MHLKMAEALGMNGTYERIWATLMVTMSSRPKVIFDQMTAPVLEIWVALEPLSIRYIPIMWLLFHGCRKLGSSRRIRFIGFVMKQY
jgi:hypothetical protein